MTVTTMQPRSPMATSDWTDLVEAVREEGRYGSAAEAESVTHTVLLALSAHLPATERAELTPLLPTEAPLCAPLVPRPLTAREFVESVAPHIENATPATARWHVTSVLTALAQELGASQTARLLAQLPPGYALLFGLADLAAVA
ncbi:uncharacterized protein (DUF2267 family) [Streptomyces sp. BK022]|uniref:DUF2267 domain-containing protein n=1 Tax=Streptomyces sp. BK022 TaxID=2512123 RepID=UPI0010294866|nr:DUF2267 domain-containing protein [Streptomyces sp. BK022]RZU37266.1 uncharacterized protein (DUF2267 family) [Streptomyces sp. BK022]